jgi:hypothetical protein
MVKENQGRLKIESLTEAVGSNKAELVKPAAKRG